MRQKRRFPQLPATLPPLNLAVEKSGGPGDFVVVAEWRGKYRRFNAAYLSIGTPRNLGNAITKLKAIAADASAHLPMLVAPYLGLEALATLERAGMSGIDLSGNGVVIVPGEWLVYRTGEKNRYPASTRIRDVYRGTSSLVGRVFLSRPEFPRFTAIQEEIRARGGAISAPTVSKVLRVLEDELIVERGDSGVIRLLAPERLLDRLAAAYRFTPIRAIRGAFTDPEDRPGIIRERAEKAGERLLIREEFKYVLAPYGDDVVTYYTTSIDRALSGTAFEEEPRYGDTQIVETHQAEAYFDAREDRGALYASPLQIYLELANGGKREREVAGPLRADLLNFRFG